MMRIRDSVILIWMGALAISVASSISHAATSTSTKATNPWDLNSVLRATSAVVECDVTQITQTYDDAWGPRTVFTCSNVTSLVGPAPGSELKLSLFGGPLPNGHAVEMSSMPRLKRGCHYALFLDGTSWFWTPVISELSLRVEKVAGIEVLLNDSGHVLTAVAPEGLIFSPDSLYMPPASARLGAGLDAFGAPPLATGVTVPPTVIDRKNLAAALRASLANAAVGLSPLFSPVPSCGRKWNEIPASKP